MAFAVAKACTKVGVTGGAIYWSVQQGVWGTSVEGAEAMKKFKASISPDGELAPKPKVKPVATQVHEGVILSSWNQGAKTVFECLRDVPEYMDQASSSVSNWIQDTFKS